MKLALLAIVLHALAFFLAFFRHCGGFLFRFVLMPVACNIESILTGKRIMTTFLDGPAQGKTLMLRRAPYFLRVTHGPRGLDALDQIGDEPTSKETVTVYVRQPGAVEKGVHLNCGKNGGSGWYCVASYKHSENQPTDAEMRGNTRWRAWCQANAPTP